MLVYQSGSFGEWSPVDVVYQMEGEAAELHDSVTH